MDKKDLKNKIIFKLFEDFKADNEKIPALIEELKKVAEELKSLTHLPKTTVDDYEFIDLKNWELEGGRYYEYFEEDKTHEGELWLHKPGGDESFVIIFEWWEEQLYSSFSEVSGPESEWDLHIDIKSVSYFEDDGSNEIEIPLTSEVEQLAETIIVQRNLKETK